MGQPTKTHKAIDSQQHRLLLCLMCQPAPKDEQFVAMGNERWMPAGLMDRNIEHWLGEASLCKKALGRDGGA